VPCAHPDRDAALSWLHAEHANLVAAIQHAAGQGPYEFAYLLTDALTGYFRMHNHTPQWLTAGQAGLHAAEQAADRTAEAATHTSLGAADRAAGDYLAALDHYRRAIATHRAIGTRDAQADVLARTALVRWEQGELEAARHDLAGALALHRELNDDAGRRTPWTTWPACITNLATSRRPWCTTPRPWRSSAGSEPDRTR
jgi:tetratricopeptide (TPR) repeat protein